ncbi:MAG: helix-turn-helix domain-containing protein [Candidatus Omnitrophota bacterium]|nr:MAG: helix-turn-helix domain-containing protein [Candidatus Omnitrophota bacterium]
MVILNVKEVTQKFPAFKSGLLYHWVRNGKIPHIRLNGRIFFDEERLKQWFREHAIEPSSGI